MRKISVITATLNSAKTIKSTLNSLLSQDYTYIEHIIVDGKSSDDTLNIIESYRPQYERKNITLIISSKKDSGIYDAFNRGIELSSGEIIGFLNADDFFASENILSLVAWGFDKPSKTAIESISANVEYVDSTLHKVRNIKGKSFDIKDFKAGLHPAHPTFYCKRELFMRFGGFDTRYKIASDYELMLRFIVKNNVNNLYIDDEFVKMRLGGISNQNLNNILKANFECFRAWKDNNLRISSLFIITKPLKKLSQTNILRFLKYTLSRYFIGGGR